MRRIGSHALLCLGMPLACMVAPPAPCAQNTATLSGVVEDARTHEPIARVLVTIPGQTSVLTDSNGHFAFDGLPVGTMPVLCRRPGYFDASTLQGTSSKQVNIPQAGAQVTLRLLPGASLHGVVTAPDGESADGVRVALFAARVLNDTGRRTWIQEDEQAAAPDGSFAFANLAPGSYMVHIASSLDPLPEGQSNGSTVQSGFLPAWSPATGDIGSATVYALGPNDNGEAALTLERGNFYPVRVPVATGEVLPDCRVSGNGFLRASLRFDRHAGVLVTALPPGNYTMRCGSSGTRFLIMQSIRGTQNHASPVSTPSVAELPLHVSAAPLITAPLTLLPAANVNLEERVNASAGTGSGAGTSAPRIETLTFQRADDPLVPIMILAVHYDDAGNPHVDGSLEPGKYWVQPAVSNGYVSSLTSVGASLFNEPLAVTAGSPVDLQATVAAGSSTLAVTLSGDLAQQDCRVAVLPMGNNGGGRSQTVDAGTSIVSFSGLPPGAYMVFATLARGDVAFREPGVLQQINGTAVSVAEGANSQTTLSSLTTLPASAVGIP